MTYISWSSDFSSFIFCSEKHFSFIGKAQFRGATLSSSKLLVTRTGIKALTSSILGHWFPWPIYIFFEMRFDLGTFDSGERSLPFGLLVRVSLSVSNQLLL